MKKVNKKLQTYIEKEIFPLYERNDAGHNIEHIRYVLRRSLTFAEQFDDINVDMVYVIAVFHDLEHFKDKENHEVLSANAFYKNEEMKKYFTEEERLVMRDAIIDHRASLEYEPRSIYGKIVSSADRTIDLDTSIVRAHQFVKKRFPTYDFVSCVEDSYRYILNKYGACGYAKSYVVDEEYEAFLKEVRKILEDKVAFVKKYMEVNHIQDIKEYAKYFAIQAHQGQIRKSEPDKPKIIHPMAVGRILEEFGCDESVVSAGYLHDVVEDTKYELEDISREFGNDIASLVMGASESDKKMSWKERKQETIDKTRTLPLRKKLVICADKINNLEDLYLTFEKNGKRDFSAFNKGEELQYWYYKSVYESLIFGENEQMPLFRRLKQAIDKVFLKKEDKEFSDIIFVHDKDYYAKLRQLHARKEEIKGLKDFISLEKPFVIEFCGTVNSGKSCSILNLYDFFNKGGLDIGIADDFHALPSKDIVLVEHAITEMQICNYIKVKYGYVTEEEYFKLRQDYVREYAKKVDYLVLLYTDAQTALRREYANGLSLEKSNYVTLNNIEEFNANLIELEHLYQNNANSSFIDTTHMEQRDIALKVAENVMPVLRKRYLHDFKEHYKVK